MKPTNLLFALLVIFVISTTIALAQPSLPGVPSQAPIDGGLGLLAVAGGAYAWKKLTYKRK